MPSRFRPYYPYRRAAQQTEPSYSGALEAGSKFGKMLAGGIGQAIAQSKQDAVANQLMNTATPPRAGLVDPGINPQTGQPNVIGANVPTAGTSPITGGLAEMKVRQQFAQGQLNDALRQAQIAKTLAAARGSGFVRQAGVGRGSGRPGKPPAYVAGSGDVENDPSTDDFGQIQTDLDHQYGKNTYNALVKNIGNMRPDGKGNMVLMKPPGEDYVPDPNKPDPNQGWTPVTDKNGLNVYSLPIADANHYMQRYNAARVAHNQEPLGDLGAGTNPNSGKPAGKDPLNPVKAESQLQIRSLPYGTWILTPDGQVRQKLQKPGGQASAEDLTGSDTGLASADTDTGLGSTEDLSEPEDLYS